jgi:hypothetical protein
MDGFVSDLSNAHFWARQICHDGNALAEGPRNSPKSFYDFLVTIEIAMREVEASYIHPCPNHLFHNSRRR